MKNTNLIRRGGKFLVLAAVVGGSLLFTACSDDTDPVDPVVDPVENTDTTGLKTSYTNDVKSIFDGSCAFSGCHATGSGVGSLATYSDAKTYTQTGRVLGALKHESGFSNMPKNSAKLSDDKIAAVEKWIADGYLE